MYMFVAGALSLRIPDANDVNMGEPKPAQENQFITFDDMSDALDPWEIPSTTDDGIDFDDGLGISFEYHLSESMWKDTRGKSGEEIAQQWDSCKELNYQHFLQNYGKHSEDAVASKLHNFMFVDNVKAGSSSIRALLKNALHASWYSNDFGGNRTHSGRANRFSTADYPEQAMLFKFSLVRDPVAKFESGVRQAWAQDPGNWEGMSADEVLDKVIRNYKEWASNKKGNRSSAFNFGNEHLQPSSYRLFTFDGNSHPSLIHVDYIGQLEQFEPHWPTIVGSFKNVTEEAKAKLLNHMHANSRPRTEKSKLSEAGIKRLCASELYKFEWSCFSYPLPDVCQ
jgi:hypothetical protein